MRYAGVIMRIEGQDAWLEWTRRHDAEAFAVRCAVDGYAAENERVWIDAKNSRAFLEALRQLERERRGEARIEAMSPDEFELTICISDRLGHVSAVGLIGRLRHDEHQRHHLLTRFAFEFDPSSLPQLVAAVAELVGAA